MRRRNIIGVSFISVAFLVIAALRLGLLAWHWGL